MDSANERSKSPHRSFSSRFRSVSLSYASLHFATSGVSVAVATVVTHPLDVLKARLQMQLIGHRGPLIGMGDLLAQLIKMEGHRALYLGLIPALVRSTLYGGLRLGLYEPCKYFCDTLLGSTNFLAKIASGALSGTVATALTNPTEVLKVRMQVNGTLASGPIEEMRKITAEGGMKALWKGVGPAMTRASALTASQMATYDESKQLLLNWTSLEEGFHLHIISSGIAGTVGTLVTAPVDMVMRTEGFRALYKGGLATFARLGPQTTITFIVYEKLRKLAGMKAM